jgi:hypothetical protein
MRAERAAKSVRGAKTAVLARAAQLVPTLLHCRTLATHNALYYTILYYQLLLLPSERSWHADLQICCQLVSGADVHKKILSGPKQEKVANKQTIKLIPEVMNCCGSPPPPLEPRGHVVTPPMSLYC